MATHGRERPAQPVPGVGQKLVAPLGVLGDARIQGRNRGPGLEAVDLAAAAAWSVVVDGAVRFQVK